MPSPPPIRFAMLSDGGRVRVRNEDAYAADVRLGVFVVCDGVGGAAGGDVASTEAAQSFLAYIRQHDVTMTDEFLLEQAVRRANSLVYDRALRQPGLQGMGTTLVALRVAADGRAVIVAHVGDSRCYRWRAGALTRLTDDHSLVEDQVRAGEISAAEARTSHLRNIITRVIGSQAHVDPEVAQHAAQPGDVYLLCSDGLTRDLTDDEIATILQEHGDTPDRAARALVDAANGRGGGDNTTVALVELLHIR